MEATPEYYPACPAQVDQARASYERVHGPGAPQPTPAGTYAVCCEQRRSGPQHYLVLGDARRILGVYRIGPGGSLHLRSRWPRILTEQHRAQVRRDQ